MSGGEDSVGARKAPTEQAEGTGIVIRDKRKIRRDDQARPIAAKSKPEPQPDPPAQSAGSAQSGSEEADKPIAKAKAAAVDGAAVVDDAAVVDGAAVIDGEVVAGDTDEEESAASGSSASGLAASGSSSLDEGAAPIGAELRELAAELSELRSELDERLRDLQRVTAEYANYRKRVDRDRALVGEQATGAVLAALLPILDDLDRAKEHGDLVGPFGAVADQLTGALTKFGLTPFGEKGDPFDPTHHEAVAHQTSTEVSEATCVNIMRRGYLLGSRLLRPALVAVAEPE